MKQVNKFKYYNLYTFATGMLFYSPILLLIFMNRGISASELFFYEIAFFLSIFIFEIPTGILGDIYGHDKVTKFGIILSIIANIIFAFAYTGVEIWISQFILGISFSVVNGSQQVTLEKLCIQENESYMIVRKTSYRYFVIGNVIAFTIAGIINSKFPSGEINILLSSLSWFVAYFLFNKHLSYIDEDNLKNVENHQIQIPTFDIKDSLKNRNLMIVLILLGVILSSCTIMYWFQQLYYQQNNVSAKWVGIIYSIIAILAFIFSKKLSISNKGENPLFIITLPIAFLLFNINTVYLIPVVVILMALIKSELSPFVENVILNVSHNNKSTNLSIMSSIDTFISVILLGACYLLLSFLPQKTVIFIISIFLAIMVLCMLFIFNKLVYNKKEPL